MIPFDWNALPRPIIALSPMAGYTDSAFRRLVKELVPRTVCFTEFTNTDGILHNSRKSMQQLQFHQDEYPLIVQVFGKHPEKFGEASRIVEDLGAAGIDINMGCPTRKAAAGCYGAGLLTDKQRALDIVRETIQAVTIPVSVKTRLGFHQPNFDELSAFAIQLQDLGIQNLTIHGRTAMQGYKDTADYSHIYRLKDILHISVIGNGDIRTSADYWAKLQNLDGLMIGRGVIANPWLMFDIDHPESKPLSFRAKIPFILKHAEYVYEAKGDHGIKELRKYLVQYVKGLPHATDYRQRLVHVMTISEIEEILLDFADHLDHLTTTAQRQSLETN